MDYKSAVKELSKGKINPVYVCYGPESYLTDDFIRRLTDRLVEPDQRTFAVTKYDLAETPLELVLEEAETLPFMVPHKLVIASNAVFFTGAKDNGKIEHRTERLLEYIASPVDYSVIVFTVNADKLDERKKLVKALKDANCLVACAAPSADELTSWVAKQAERLGFTFERGAAEQFILYAGTHLQALSQELEKCALYVGRGGTLTAAHVEQLVTRTTEQNVFILIEDIVQLKLDRAFTILHELIKMKEEPIKLLMLIARQFRIMYQVKDLTQQGYSQQQIGSQIGVHPYAVKIAAGQAAKYDIKKLAGILGELADLDFQMKSGRIDKVMGLELFMLKLAG
ncbi:DNA polymerase III subunit delta [Paenibacillus thalictri]|uniref:DNA polymerase III subunit delta n=1 Tax=Paenibacillus thalictri TaxID=2527873 RepID=A0A4Q9DKS5_9BACL|nr:DNA polymerase III subunit delta [Paenibacillus thalictri]TBL75393.1 DNA polymerase III subunit delta [Paenibacillus thalictri]